ncbi:MAG: transposase [Bacteroides sp.]|nr:transposase [Bacteroides sp.]
MKKKLLVSVFLSMSPPNNFYRRLKSTLDISFIRDKTRSLYGTEGQKSIDPVVFFKLMLIGYIENLNSDRRIIEMASMQVDMLYFLDYNIDEKLPRHSTLSRTRKLYPEDLFVDVFSWVVHLCVCKGMCKGTRQAVDSASRRANASMDSLIRAESLDYLRELGAVQR